MAKKGKFSLIIVFIFFYLFSSVYAQDQIWTKIKKSDQKTLLSNQTQSSFELDVDVLKNQLKSAPLRGVPNFKSSVIVSFPNNKGELEKFIVYEAPVLSNNLSTQYPNIKTYIGYSTQSNGNRVRFSVTPPLGLNAMLSFIVDPIVLELNFRNRNLFKKTFIKHLTWSFTLVYYNDILLLLSCESK